MGLKKGSIIRPAAVLLGPRAKKNRHPLKKNPADPFSSATEAVSRSGDLNDLHGLR